MAGFMDFIKMLFWVVIIGLAGFGVYAIIEKLTENDTKSTESFNPDHKFR